MIGRTVRPDYFGVDVPVVVVPPPIVLVVVPGVMVPVPVPVDMDPSVLVPGMAVDMDPSVLVPVIVLVDRLWLPMRPCAVVLPFIVVEVLPIVDWPLVPVDMVPLVPIDPDVPIEPEPVDICAEAMVGNINAAAAIVSAIRIILSCGMCGKNG